MGGEKTIQVKRSLLTQKCIDGTWVRTRFSSGRWETDSLDMDAHRGLADFLRRLAVGGMCYWMRAGALKSL